MLVGLRGGRPHIFWEEAVDDTAGVKIPFTHDLGSFTSNHLTVTNVGASAARLYFSETDFEDDAALAADPKRYIPLAAVSGQYEGPDALDAVWVRAESGGSTDIVVVARAISG